MSIGSPVDLKHAAKFDVGFIPLPLIECVGMRKKEG
jgi:hypothetical protein